MIFIVFNGVISAMIFATMKIKNKVVYTNENISQEFKVFDIYIIIAAFLFGFTS